MRRGDELIFCRVFGVLFALTGVLGVVGVCAGNVGHWFTVLASALVSVWCVCEAKRLKQVKDD